MIFENNITPEQTAVRIIFEVILEKRYNVPILTSIIFKNAKRSKHEIFIDLYHFNK